MHFSRSGALRARRRNNQFTTRGVVTSRRAGGFKLDLLTVGFFAPIPGRPVQMGLSTFFCPDKCTTAGTVGTSTTEVAITPKGIKAGEIESMFSGVQIIKRFPIPLPGKPIQVAAGELVAAAFGAAEALAKKNGVTIWVRVSCTVCEKQSCFTRDRMTLVDRTSAWEKVFDLEMLTKDAGASLTESYTREGINQAIKEKAETLTCP